MTRARACYELITYISFCVATAISCLQLVKCFSDNKLASKVTSEVTAVINRKKAAFANRDKDKIKTAYREMRNGQGKRNYRLRVEDQLSSSNSRDLWKGMKVITGHCSSSVRLHDNFINPETVNTFFARFDVKDFSVTHESVYSA